MKTRSPLPILPLTLLLTLAACGTATPPSGLQPLETQAAPPAPYPQNTYNTIVVSNTFTADLPALKAAFPLFDWTADGCSSPLPTVWSLVFHPACVQHDFGYRNVKFYPGLHNENYRKIIDDQMLEHMRVICNAFNPIDKAKCLLAAEVFYGAVRLGGERYFQVAQNPLLEITLEQLPQPPEEGPAEPSPPPPIRYLLTRNEPTGKCIDSTVPGQPPVMATCNVANRLQQWERLFLPGTDQYKEVFMLRNRENLQCLSWSLFASQGPGARVILAPCDANNPQVRWKASRAQSGPRNFDTFTGGGSLTGSVSALTVTPSNRANGYQHWSFRLADSAPAPTP
ncbi:phospholipase A2 [Deinococcus aquaedulcis]|uniref:phospholipase A2 n=1 Tax=Deinococcus aquaedulcis TaxID=2840455 RepID=UPI001C834089|nr:phospholipase A2 [Deinococcus aquaedulcis]